ncbi:Polyketide cyclase / dehydrase and lipid transport [Gimesia panareensis]|uniref:Polyketide cyclase / dehydrase and lipid transport n=1 Tax=Gimesia panareensis TaxID=2527978 RepID=A0A517QEV2_9PLAN|nr:SRPBCC family protein [Gimesia panareensis]QDT30173.1 Polyketide cyclase / dehydrase and lipid transport [Gimesia panareensis]
MANFEASVQLTATPEEVFEFLIDTDNILKISPPDAGLTFTKKPDKLYLGATIEFRVQGFGQVQEGVHEITVFEEPRLFTEKQISGPLKHYIHEHEIVPSGDNQVTVIDRLEFQPPGGLLGFIVTESKLLDIFDEGFYHRHNALKEIFS